MTLPRAPWRRALVLSLYLFAVIVPFGAPTPNAIAEALVAISLIGTLASERRAPDLRTGGAEYFLLAYYGLGIVSAIAGVDFIASLGRLKSEAHMLFAFFLFAAAFAVEPVPEALPFLGLGYAVSACDGMFQFFLHFVVAASAASPLHDLAPLVPHFMAVHQAYMAHGVVHHITYGELMTFALAAGVSAWVFPDALPEAHRRRWLAVLFCVLCAVALLLSQARGPWLATATVVLCIAALRREARPLLGAAAGLGVVLLAVRPLVAPFLARFASIFNPEQHANAVRLELWKLAWRMFKDHPVLGVGPANFGTLFHTYYPGQLGEAETWTQVHNIYLHQLAERGVLGLAMLLALFGAFTLYAWKAYRERPSFWSLWRLAALCGFWVMNLTQNSFHTASIWMMLMFLWTWCARNAAREAPAHA